MKGDDLLFAKKVIEMVDSVIEAHPNYGSNKDHILCMPKYFFELLITSMDFHLVSETYDNKTTQSYRGYPVVFGYENKIILYHIDSPRFSDKRMKTELQIP